MGMFDYVKCLYPLPLPEGVDKLGFDQKNIRFQTKDFDNLMIEYTIRENGELWKTVEKIKWVDDDNHFLKGYLNVESSEEVKENYHGMLIFYCYEDLKQENGTTINVSIDYFAKFSDGNLVDVKMESQEITDVTEQKENCKKYFEELMKKNNKWYNKYFFRSKPYMKLKRSILRIFNIWLNFNQNLYHFLIRFL